MICTQRRMLERLARGELDEARAAEVRAHLEGCDLCAEEARLLAAERDLFTRRAALPAPAPPPFAAVMAEVRSGGHAAKRGASRARIWSLLAAAAAVIGIYVEGRSPATAPSDGGAPAIVAEPIAVAPIADPALVQRAEDDMGACLMATPAPEPTAAEDLEGCNMSCGGEEIDPAHVTDPHR